MNLEKLAKYACIVFVLLFIQVGVFALQAIDPKTFPESPVEYSLGASYQFNVTCSDSDGDVNAWLTFDSENYTMNNESNEFYVNLTDLFAGTYLYNFTCNDTVESKTTNTLSYVVKAPTSITLLIDDFESNITVDQNWIIKFNVSTNVSGRTVELWTDYPDDGWKLWDNSTEPLVNYTNMSTLGLFKFTGNFSGNENYTESNKTFYVNVTDMNPQYYDETKYPDPSFYSLEDSQFNITWADGSLHTVIFNIHNVTNENNVNITDSSPSFVSIDDNSRNYYINISSLSVGTYNYSWFANDSFGNTNYASKLLTIYPSPDLHLSINGNEVSDNIEVTTPNHVTVVCWAETLTTDKFTLQAPTLPSDKFTQTSNDTSYTRNGSTEGMLGEYNYLCYITDAALVPNYNNVSRKLTVVSPPSTGPGTSPPASGTLYFSGFKDLKVKAGTTGSLSFLLKNTFTTDKTDVQLLLSGNSEDPANPVKEGWCSLDAEKVTVPKSGSKTIKLTCKVPRAAVLGNYSLYIKAIKGSSSYPSSAKLIVEEAPPPTTTTEEEPEEEIEEEAEEEVEVLGEAELEEETPTGFILSPDILPDAILVIGFLSSGLIFLFRENVTRTFKKLGGREEIVPQKKIIKPKTSWIDRIKRTYEKYNYSLDIDFRKKYQTEFFDEEDENT